MWRGKEWERKTAKPALKHCYQAGRRDAKGAIRRLRN